MKKLNPVFRFTVLMACLLLLLITAVLLSFFVGSAKILPGDFLKILSGSNSIDKNILLQIRLPRIIIALAAGGALSLSGVLLQGVFRNPLVEPYTLGIAGGAALGVCIAVVLKPAVWLGSWLLPACGFTGAFLTISLLYGISRRNGILRVENLLLTGVMLSFIASSGLMLLMSISRAQELQTIVFWTMGSLSRAGWNMTWITLAGALAGLIFSLFFARNLNALALGEEEARHIGVKVETTKNAVFLISSFLTGLCISACGIIGFVGLVMPHLTRRFTGTDHRFLIPASFLSGAVFLLLCDTAARTMISPLELPVGVLTGLIGGTLFIVVLSKKGRLL